MGHILGLNHIVFYGTMSCGCTANQHNVYSIMLDPSSEYYVIAAFIQRKIKIKVWR